jgi:hypothetical protein
MPVDRVLARIILISMSSHLGRTRRIGPALTSAQERVIGFCEYVVVLGCSPSAMHALPKVPEYGENHIAFLSVPELSLILLRFSSLYRGRYAASFTFLSSVLLLIHCIHIVCFVFPPTLPKDY